MRVVHRGREKFALVAGGHRHGRYKGSPEKMLFAQVLERYLDPLIVEFLIVSTELVAAACGAIEELGHLADWRVCLSFELGCAADVSMEPSRSKSSTY